jgi:UDP:flavonoid glycosyltransferase YjiC (YdhE family)
LIKELEKRGITVQAWVMGAKNAAFLKGFGIDVAPPPNMPDTEELMRDNATIRQAMMDGSVLKFFKAVGEIMTQYGEDINSFIKKSSADFRPHAVAYHPLMAAAARDIHLKLKIPVCMACLFPRAPTREFAPLYFSATGIDLPFGLNRSLHWMMLKATNKAAITPEAQKSRADDGLPPLKVEELWDMFFNPRMPTVCGWSSLVAPPPADWPESIHVCGYWTLSQDEQVRAFRPSAELEQFLAGGPAPVYLGWGSMMPGSPEETAKFAVEVAKGAGVRAIVLGGWANISAASLPAGELQEYASAHMLFSSEALPHEWLFPQCSCCVHHGGAGTTAAVLRSGAPSIITPVMVDQFYWASHVNRLNVGKGFSTQLNKIKPAELSAAIAECISSSAINKNVKDLASKLVEEEGPSMAADVLEKVCRESQEGVWEVQDTAKASSGLFACC